MKTRSCFGMGMATLFLISACPSGAQAQTRLQFLPGQTIFACAKRTVPVKQPPVVCTRNVLVGGGHPISGYTFGVKPGFTLPRGIFLLSLTGVVTMQSQNSALPPAGHAQNMHLTVKDGTGRIASGIVTLQMEAGAVCGCPDFNIEAGGLPPAQANRPYAVTLAVIGPSTTSVLRPNYRWRVSRGSSLPTGLVLDQARGVLRGTPAASTAGEDFSFFVTVTETHTRETVRSDTPYTLHVN